MKNFVRRASHALLLFLPLPLSLFGCGAGEADVVVERVDSVGVEVVTSLGGDRPLGWILERELALGGAEAGPEAFFNVGTGALATAGDTIHVLDRGNHRVVTFDGEGRHVRTVGRKGGGPGELQWPSSLVVASDGSLVISDIGHRGLLRLTPEGEPLGGDPEVEGWHGGRMSGYGEGLVIQVGASSGEQLVHLVGDDRTEILTAPRPELRQVDLGCVQIGGLPQYFAPSLSWGAGGDRLVANAAAGYELDVYSGTDHVRRIRRDVPSRPATVELAIQEVGEKFEVKFGGGGSCVVPPEKVVEARGYAEELPAIRRVAVAPDGTVWVQRFVVKGEEAPVDLFGADGAYLGTLPEGTPFPDAFFDADRFATTEKDELDVDHVVVYRVGRSAG